MEERARLKALEALFDPTTTARIGALPAAGEVVIAVEASPVSQYDLTMIPPLVRQYGHRRSRPRDRSGQRPERRRRAGSQQNPARGAGTRRRPNVPETVTAR